MTTTLPPRVARHQVPHLVEWVRAVDDRRHAPVLHERSELEQILNGGQDVSLIAAGFARA